MSALNKKRKESSLIHIKDLIHSALNNCRPASDLNMTKIWDIWEDAVGAPIAQNAQPHSFKNGQLIVTVSSSSWIFQLKFLEKDMILNINRKIELNIVEQIRFKIGNIHG